MNLTTKKKQTHRHRAQTCGCQGRRVGEGWVVFLYICVCVWCVWVCVRLLYPFTCWWTFRFSSMLWLSHFLNDAQHIRMWWSPSVQLGSSQSKRPPPVQLPPRSRVDSCWCWLVSCFLFLLICPWKNTVCCMRYETQTSIYYISIFHLYRCKHWKPSFI